jgi:uncharacterized membrane protein
LLVIALAYPYTDTKKLVEGEPHVRILLDNSTSMRLYNTSFVSNLKEQISKQIPVDFAVISNGESSAIGDGLIGNIRKDDNLLLITDGNVNKGVSLEDAILFARNVNATVSAINLNTINLDAGISIIGPDKTTAKADNKFTVKVAKDYNKPVTIMISIDNVPFETKTIDDKTGNQYVFTKAFEAGQHQIQAQIVNPDYFKENNVFYKIIKVVPKPKVLYLTAKDSPLVNLFNPVYDVIISGNLADLNGDLSTYTAIALNDLSADQIDKYSEQLSNFVIDGNGLFVIGGKGSYEAGSYKGSKLEQILPVTVATAGKKKGDVNVVILLDISGSTGTEFGQGSQIDTEKALAVGILRDMSMVNNVGVVAFNSESYLIENVSLLLGKSLPAIEDKIMRLRDSGNTLMYNGLLLSTTQLQGFKGSKNIIIISDGKTQEKDRTLSAANFVSSRGIRIYTVGVGYDTDVDTMQEIARIGSGTFFQPDTKQSLKLIFGDTEKVGNRKVIPIAVFDKSHFVTDDLAVKGNVYGFNSVVPKQAASMLVTTDVGDPILVVGRWGLGRVAAFASDDGGLFAGELLNKDNSRIYTKTMNWLIGDPERNNEYYLTIPDGFSGGNIEATLKTSAKPSFSEVNFIKYDTNLYKAIIPVNNTGVFSLASTTYAVNYNTEYLHPGIYENLENDVASTNGKMFNAESIDDIVAFVKASSKREVHDNKNLAWIFVLAALLVYLIEVCFRRILRNFYKG